MKRLTITQYLNTESAYPVSPATVRKYIEKGILPGEKVMAGNTNTYYVHIIEEEQDDLLKRMIAG